MRFNKLNKTHNYLIANCIIHFSTGAKNLFLISTLSLFHTIASSKSVYYVAPNHSGLSSNNSPGAHSLNYYLLNASKYFTSNVKLKLLSGVHQLDSAIVIKDTHHFSLLGCSRNGKLNSTVECVRHNPGGIIISNSSYITLQNIILKDCGTVVNYALYLRRGVAIGFSSASLLINNSHSLNISHVTALQIFTNGIVLINILNSNLNNISSNGMVVIYNNDMNNNYTNIKTLLIEGYNYASGSSSFETYEMVLNFIEYSREIKLQISNVQFTSDKAIFVYSSNVKTSCDGIIKITFLNCSFDNIKAVTKSDEQDSIITIIVDNYLGNCIDSYSKHERVTIFMNCTFSHNINENDDKYIIKFYNVDAESFLYIVNSQFCNNSGTTILMTPPIQDVRNSNGHTFLIIKNVTFVRLLNVDFVMVLRDADVTLEGPVLFSEMEIDLAVIYGRRIKLVFNNYIEFSDIDTFYIILNECIYLNPDTHIYLTSNIIRDDIFANEDLYHTKNPLLYSRPCILQYISKSLQDYHLDFTVLNLNISLIITKTIFGKLCQYKYCVTHCSWIGNGLFKEINPLVVNRQVIKFVDRKDANTTLSDKKDICYCTVSYSYNCYLDEINSVYPGQTVFLHLISTIADAEYLTITVNTTATSCRVAKSSEIEQRVYNNCTLVHFTIQYYKNCNELFLSYPPFGADVFYVNFLPCPIGFSLDRIEGYCQCDPILTSATIISITTCNINDQTILRPGNSWIAITSNHTYQVSSHCPFQYCLSSTSFFNLFNPDDQCLFNRTSLLCGKCQKGLSTVFGTHNCKQCSNAFIFTILPIAMAGIVLLVILFMLNVTVTDGTINAFILFANIVSINSSIIFTHQSTAHIFVSLANLDLGFEMCFYNGMNDYIKIWLQLAFPVYLIIIATSLIIASRYSTRIQRLTARRALAVLATLFLLSYTKILRTVSNVLFFYSEITNLPNNKTTIVWSVDANVPLFGVKFTILFTVCLISLIIMIPFTVVLTFTRLLSRHKMINYFKPLLDAYQGPYKNPCYFWPGLQLMIRAIFFGLSALDNNINLAIGVVLLAAILGIHGYVRPFKSTFKNIQEFIFIFNLTVLFVFLLSESISNAIIVNTSVAIASVHFVVILLNNLWQYQCLPTLESISRKHENIATLKEYIINKCRHCIKRNQSNNNHEQNIPLRNVVPDVAYNFKEYREPLIGQDN